GSDYIGKNMTTYVFSCRINFILLLSSSAGVFFLVAVARCTLRHMFRKNVTTLLIFCSNSGRSNLHRVIGVSFGLLCVLQAALNICLVKHKYGVRVSHDRNFQMPDDHYPYFHQGWFHFQKSLYYISSVKNTWHLSREYCLQEGADLAIINSRAEQNFKMTLWIGLMEQRSERTWRWVDGTPLTEGAALLYWSSKEPNGGKDENCVDIKNFNAEKSWNDESCSLSLLWICEKKLFQ
uniref:C-type lectin domain-containing protein n=1 Tax=Takifugu rubripes TaxID=31033 RepID=A0A674NLR3_TAKRU